VTSAIGVENDIVSTSNIFVGNIGTGVNIDDVAIKRRQLQI
jgi:hypothetical protein